MAATLSGVINELPKGGPSTVIVPRTVTVEEYWSETISYLDPSVRVIPVALLIDPVEHQRRATNDTEEPDAVRWLLSNFPLCEAAGWIRSEFTSIDVSSLSREQNVASIRAVSFPPADEVRVNTSSD